MEGANRSRLIVAPVLRVRLARVNWALLLPTVPESAEMLFAPLARVTAPRVSVELNCARPLNWIVPPFNVMAAESLIRSATSLVPVLSIVRVALFTVSAGLPVTPSKVPPSLRDKPPPINLTVPVVLLALASVRVLPPAFTKLRAPPSEPRFPAYVPFAPLVVSIPVPVTLPPEPSTVPLLMKLPTYWLFAPRTSVPPLSTKALLVVRVLLPPPRVSVPSLIKVEPV